MDEEFFDYAIEGTTLRELFEHDSSKRVVVLDRSANYGTTYSSLSALQYSPYVSDFRVLKDRLKGVKCKIRIESLPFLLGSKDKAVQQFKHTVFGSEIEYVEINEIYLFSSSFFKIPTSKNDIVALGLSKTDMFYLYKSIKNHDLGILRTRFSDKSHPIYRALVELEVFGPQDFRKYCENFGSTLFLYPAYGLSEISESVCMSNAFKGATYVLNKNLDYTVDNSREYSHRFTCDLGVIHAKEYLKQDLRRKPYHIRVILTQKQKFTGNFLGFIERPFDFVVTGNEEIHLSSKYTRIIGINCLANVCDEGLQLLYFINEHNNVTNYEVESLSIYEKDILLDISYKTVYDIEQFKVK
ncbi:uncharacterized protein VICG_00454 [Vittaforma corneae ATCC 50505]|uniref:Rab GDP dissociation inhibitor n=1 Tax=Vittaforma corneae (strain ATCC 50505) TaxID=993615 RepID=L2GNE1_VITCO|nr:uncharacterized protein VICG_00454 [Vittaforma corneae ATCC 50505]ELA42356.1 hypothetical protein VICG_00454 [Vittaforma corneae ATCC 50505]